MIRIYIDPQWVDSLDLGPDFLYETKSDPKHFQIETIAWFPLTLAHLTVIANIK